jgi:hypothetical protein
VLGMARTVTGFHRPSQVALNALTFVSELVSVVGRLARPRVVRVGVFSVVEVFRRASLVRVGTWSRRPVSVGRVFGVVFSGVCFS